MRPLRILLALAESPLPFGNASGRWYYILLRGLVERGHRVTAFAACARSEDAERSQALFPRPQYDLRCYPFPRRGGWRAKLQTVRRPYSYMFAPELRADLAREAGNSFDVLHLEQLWSGWLGLEWKSRAVVDVHYLLSLDLEDTPPRGARGRMDRWLMRRGEEHLLRSYSHFFTVSPRLTEVVRRKNPAAQVQTVPHGLELSFYPYIDDGARTREPVVSVIGSMGWSPSRSAAVRFLTRLWPQIRRRLPEARAQIIGWEARTALRDFLSEPGVVIEENVPDIRPYFERTGVLLYAPSRGSGIKMKILEAMAFGVPVVTTTEGVEGLHARDGIHAGVCDDDAGLVERTVRLLCDPAAQDRQRAAGRALVQEDHSLAPCLDRVEGAYASLLGTRHVADGRRRDLVSA
jgi:glycosyltransferase involved in cell wall biosynthesis